MLFSFKLHNNTLLQFNISEEANHSLSLIDLLSDSTVTNASVSDHEKTILSHKIVPVETAKYDDVFLTSTPSKRNKLHDFFPASLRSSISPVKSITGNNRNTTIFKCMFKSSYSDLLGIATNPSGSVLKKKLQSKSKNLQSTYDTPIAIPEDDVYPTASQRHTLENNEWLDDVLMNLGQNLLRKQHPKMNGLQSVLLGQKFAFVPQFEEFVQILHINGNYWITVSTVGCKPATINVYDSQHGFLSSRTKCLIAGIIKAKPPR